MDTILALDIGTSSTRAVLYHADTVIAVGDAAAREHQPEMTTNGGATLDANALVSEAVACMQTVLARGGLSNRVVGVAVCTFWHSFVGVDAAGRALTPVLLWSDRRSSRHVARLRETIDTAAYTQRTGCPLHPSYFPGRLWWLRDHDAATFNACVRFVSPGEYLFAQMFGLERVTCSVSMASGSGLMDQSLGTWDRQTLPHLPGVTPDRFSPIDDRPVTGLREPHRAALGPLADVPWFPALGDGACSNLGCGAVEPDRLALMIGTSGALRAGLGATQPPVPAGLWRYQVDESQYLVGGALSNGGNVWSWLARTLRLPDLDPVETNARLEAMPPDGHGLTLLPFLHGERAPGWHDDARAVMVGLGAATTPLDITRAHLEAVAYRFAAVRDRLRSLVPQATILGTGAGLRASPVWAQILADVLGEPVLVSREEQASARGAALWVRNRLGLGSAREATFGVERHCDPNPHRAERYQEARARHEVLYQRWENGAV